MSLRPTALGLAPLLAGACGGSHAGETPTAPSSPAVPLQRAGAPASWVTLN